MTTTAIDMRTCHRCETAKPPEAFWKNKRTLHGRDYWCAECSRQYQREKGYTKRKRGVRKETDDRTQIDDLSVEIMLRKMRGEL